VTTNGIEPPKPFRVALLRILEAKRAKKVKALEVLTQRLAAARQEGSRSRDIGTKRNQAVLETCGTQLSRERSSTR
jgi:hypothetical protein